jgi:hypothetical protein
MAETIQQMLCPQWMGLCPYTLHCRLTIPIQFVRFIHFLPPMASSSRAKASGVSSSSFFDLRAEISRKEEEFSRDKAKGKARAPKVGGSRGESKDKV